MPSITRECPSCGKFYRIDISRDDEVPCRNCGKRNRKIDSDSVTFSRCVICDCGNFYKQKDFNQVLGCFIVLIGAGLMPITYGFSLPVLILIDWFLYRKTDDVIICYRCKSEYRDFSTIPQTITSFDHHTGELYETD